MRNQASRSLFVRSCHHTDAVNVTHELRTPLGPAAASDPPRGLTPGDRGHTGRMPSFTERIQKFLSSPQGKRLVTEGRRQLAKPENQNRLRRLLARLQGRRGSR